MSTNRIHRAPEHSKGRDVLSELGHLRRMASDTQAMLSTLSLEPPEELRIASCVAGFIDGLAVEIEQERHRSSPTELFRYGYVLCRRQMIVGLTSAVEQLAVRWAALKTRVTGTTRHSLPLFEDRLAHLKAKVEALSWTCRHKLDDLRLAVSDYVALRETLLSFEEMQREARSWGNPRHHFIGILIALLVGIILIPLSPFVQNWWVHVAAAFNPTAIVTAVAKPGGAQAAHTFRAQTAPLGHPEASVAHSSPAKPDANENGRY
ncbi:MAG: hypothetical protein KGJ49_05000 [Alphaproteobacteria bacterium]|nr:hypothetical protein [Alphaproteobacteria bacterium]